MPKTEEPRGTSTSQQGPKREKQAGHIEAGFSLVSQNFYSAQYDLMQHLAQKVQDLRGEVAHLKKQSADRSSEHAHDLRKRDEASNQHVNDLKSQLQAFKYHNTSLEARVTLLEKLWSTDVLADVCKAMQGRQKALERALDEASQAKQLYSEFDADLKNTRADVGQIKSDLETLNSSINKYPENIAEWIDEFGEEIHHPRCVSEQSRTQSNDGSEKSESLQAEMDGSTEEVRQLAEEDESDFELLAKPKTQTADYFIVEKQNEEHDLKFSIVQKCMQYHEIRLKTAEQKLASLYEVDKGDDSASASEGNDELRREIEELRRETKELREENNDYKRATNSLEEEIESIKNDNASTIEYVLCLSKRVCEVRRTVDNSLESTRQLTEQISNSEQVIRDTMNPVDETSLAENSTEKGISRLDELATKVNNLEADLYETFEAIADRLRACGDNTEFEKATMAQFQHHASCLTALEAAVAVRQTEKLAETSKAMSDQKVLGSRVSVLHSAFEIFKQTAVDALLGRSYAISTTQIDTIQALAYYIERVERFGRRLTKLAGAL